MTRLTVRIELKPGVSSISVAAYLRGVEGEILRQPTRLEHGDGGLIRDLDGETVGHWTVEGKASP